MRIDAHIYNLGAKSKRLALVTSQLESVPKPLLTLNNNNPLVSLPIGKSVHHKILSNMQNSHSLRHNSRYHRRRILWRISLSKDVRSDDPANRSAANDERASNRPLTLPNDIVMHVAQDGRDVRIAPADTEEDASVPRARARADETHHGDADDCRGSVQDQHQASLAVAVCEPGGGQHPRRCSDVGREGEDLRHGGAVAHVAAQDDGEEEAEGVGDNVVEEVQPGPLPEFPVAEVVQDFVQVEGVDHGVATVAVNAGFDDGCFFGGEKWAAGGELGLRAAVGKVDDEDVAHDA